MATDINLTDIYLFRHLSSERQVEVNARMSLRRLPAGGRLFEQGDAGDELFIVREGCVAIFTPSASQPGTEQAIRRFCRGEVLGEMALIDQKPRSLSARAEEPSELLVLQGDDFRQLIRDDPGVALAAMSGLNDRIRYTTDFIEQVRHWIEHMASGKYKADEFHSQMQAWVQTVGDAGGADRDDVLSTLAAEFVEMAARVREREEALQRQVEQLKIEVDAAKRERQVSEIVETEFFASLRTKAASMRQKRE